MCHSGGPMSRNRTSLAIVASGGLPLLLAGCAGNPLLSDRECMTRAMYFESNRSSPDGMLAVGTTVMNRVAAPGYPKTVCGVVGQPRQYADGVLTKPMNARESGRVAAVAEAVLAGQRHPQVGGALFFHTAGLTFPYTNMHYVAVAGGNAFYEKRAPERDPEASSAERSVEPGAPPSVVRARSGRPGSIDDLLAAWSPAASPILSKTVARSDVSKNEN